MPYPDFEEFLGALNARGVRYLVGGAHALAHHALPRATKDIDLFIDPTEANARRTARAIRDFFGGKAPRYATAQNLLDPSAIVQLGVAPVRIDIFNRLDGVGRFSTAWRERITAPFGSVTTHYLSLEHLMAEKAYWGRPQDLADLYSLERARKALSGRRAQGRRKKPR
jgi:hypothetical protein